MLFSFICFEVTTARRDEATCSYRNLISDDCLAKHLSTFDHRLVGNCDASTLRVVSGEDPDKVQLAWFPSDSDVKSVTTVRKRRLRRDMTPEERKKAEPNLLPQRMKLLVTGTPSGATAPVVVMWKIKKTEFKIPDNGPLKAKFQFTSKDSGPSALPGHLVLRRKQETKDRDYDEKHSDAAIDRWHSGIIKDFFDMSRTTFNLENSKATLSFDGENGQMQGHRWNRQDNMESAKGSAACTSARQPMDKAKAFWVLKAQQRKKKHRDEILCEADARFRVIEHQCDVCVCFPSSGC